MAKIERIPVGLAPNPSSGSSGTCLGHPDAPPSCPGAPRTRWGRFGPADPRRCPQNLSSARAVQRRPFPCSWTWRPVAPCSGTGPRPPPLFGGPPYCRRGRRCYSTQRDPLGVTAAGWHAVLGQKAGFTRLWLDGEVAGGSLGTLNPSQPDSGGSERSVSPVSPRRLPGKSSRCAPRHGCSRSWAAQGGAARSGVEGAARGAGCVLLCVTVHAL